jgi:sulfide:quinone oxidoreductase
MKMQQLTEQLYVASQPVAADMARSRGRRARHHLQPPRRRGADQPGFREMADAARALGLPRTTCRWRRARSPSSRPPNSTPAASAAQAGAGLLPQRHAQHHAVGPGQRRPAAGGADRQPRRCLRLRPGALARRLEAGAEPFAVSDASHQVVIVGGGAAGIAVAASLLARDATLDIAIIDPADVHYYQPGWTLVGAGVFEPAQTARVMGALIPRGVRWIKSAVSGFEPERNLVLLEGCRTVRYQQLVVCPGLKLNWDAIAGLGDTLGRNGVTSNYRYDLAPYTWELVRQFRGGRPCSRSRRCRSSAPARRRKPCICRATPGAATACWRTAR